MSRPHLPLRVTIDTTIMHRRARSFDHAELCRAFNLDPASHSFDLPRTAYDDSRDKSRVSGYVLRCGKPVGMLHFAGEADKFRDLDPMSERDNLDLRQCHNH